MRLRNTTIVALLLVLAGCAMALAADFTWDWHSQEMIGRHDSSLSNTSRLAEPDRAALLNLIVARLRKPMTERGYDEQRIREIASTTRLRFKELGEGKPVVLATSMGLEGGCDELLNCPFWIFRLGASGYASMLDTTASSYTIQPTNTLGFSDVVILRHVSSNESKLTLYKYQRGKYAEAGCSMATWPPPKDGEIQAPTVTPCNPAAAK